jgi:hypothetical protein
VYLFSGFNIAHLLNFVFQSIAVPPSFAHYFANRINICLLPSRKQCLTFG